MFDVDFSTMFGALLCTHNYVYTAFVACRILALPRILFAKNVMSTLKIWSFAIVIYSILSQITLIFWFAVDFLGSDKMTYEKQYIALCTRVETF